MEIFIFLDIDGERMYNNELYKKERRDARMTEIRIRSRDELASAARPLCALASGSVVALGFFDGVHVAHRELIRLARAKADAMGLPLCIFTFSGESGIKKTALRLYTDKEKAQIFSQLGADVTVSFDFGAVKDVCAADFVADILLSLLAARVAVFGFNFRFGKGAAGDARLLCNLLHAAGAEATVVTEYCIDGITVSSSVIREHIEKNEFADAARLLGTPYFITGEVKRGMGLGDRLGIPTVNTEIPPSRLCAERGVYATAAEVSGRIYPAVTNVGSCPTFGDRDVHIETHIIGFDTDVYGENIKVYFLEKLRGEKRFDDENELIMQINIDKNRALEIAGDKKWQELGLKLQ